jgi:hypothetical protein
MSLHGGVHFNPTLLDSDYDHLLDGPSVVINSDSLNLQKYLNAEINYYTETKNGVETYTFYGELSKYSDDDLTHHLNPANPDSDNGGKIDGAEYGNVQNPSDPLDGTDDNGVTPELESDEDADGDLMLNGWEIANGLNPNDPTDAILDSDNDGLSNYHESLQHTDPTTSHNINSYDTDGDGLWDGFQDLNGNGIFDAKDANRLPYEKGEDTNGNGVIESREGNPTQPDTDYDMIPDSIDQNIDIFDIGRSETFIPDIISPKYDTSNELISTIAIKFLSEKPANAQIIQTTEKSNIGYKVTVSISNYNNEEFYGAIKIKFDESSISPDICRKCLAMYRSVGDSYSLVGDASLGEFSSISYSYDYVWARIAESGTYVIKDSSSSNPDPDTDNDGLNDYVEDVSYNNEQDGINIYWIDPEATNMNEANTNNYKIVSKTDDSQGHNNHYLDIVSIKSTIVNSETYNWFCTVSRN